jgi:hypothetical protein
VKANSVLQGLPVYDETDACVTGFTSTSLISLTLTLSHLHADCNSISGRADFANIHPYPQNGVQTIGVDGSNNVYVIFLQ